MDEKKASPNPYEPAQNQQLNLQKSHNENINTKLIVFILSIAGLFVIGSIVTVVIVLSALRDNTDLPPPVAEEAPVEILQKPIREPAPDPDPDNEPNVTPDIPSVTRPDISYVAAAGSHTIAVKSDGTILSAGWGGRAFNTPSKQIIHHDTLSGVQKIVGYSNVMAVLHTNGEVSTTLDTRDMDQFRNIIDVAIGAFHLIALKEDGTVIATGYDMYGETEVSEWSDIVAVYAGRDWSIGLKSDGTVVATGQNNYGQCDVSTWRNVESIFIGTDFTMAITSDGTILGESSYWSSSFNQIDISEFAGCIQLAGTSGHLVGLRDDGTVIAHGSNWRGQCDVHGWTDIIAISASDNYTIGLKSDGSIVYTGEHREVQLDPNLLSSNITDIFTTNSAIAWLEDNGTVGIIGRGFYFDFRWFPEFLSTIGVSNVSTVVAGESFSAALTTNGRVYTWGDNSPALMAANEWRGITAIAAGSDFLLGLKEDGTVVCTYDEQFEPINVSGWRDIVDIAAGRYFAVGLMSDGTVVADGSNYNNQLNVRDWTNIVAITAGGNFTVGLRADGTCVATGSNLFNESDVFDWTDITRIKSHDNLTIGLKNDGTVLITGNVGWGDSRIDVSRWTNMVDIAVGAYHAVGVRSDGRMEFSGNNEMGQINLRDWVLW